MNTSLVINGYALFLFVFFILLLILGFIFYGCAYVKEARKKDKIYKKYKEIRRDYNRLLGMYQKYTFKVPDIEENLDKR